MNSKLPDDAIIYVVDDDDSVRKALTRMLKTEGWNVSAFPSAEDFLAEARSDVSGCVLLDVQMPGQSGLELQELLVTHRIGLPIIFMTAHGDIPMTVKAIKAGAVDFLSKPVDRECLLQLVEEAVILHAQQQGDRAILDAFRKRIDSLTGREREVMGLVVEGLLNKQIAARLEITEFTVKVHRGRAMRKAEVESVAELVAQWERAGLAVPPSS
ncbi:response regulator transcription factor [Haloferula sp.]|uniref:response regulator transcription factor n=1 Tax=Haloferula sp. TaxID=2497595 RepID=UPI0032A01F77